MTEVLIAMGVGAGCALMAFLAVYGGVWAASKLVRRGPAPALTVKLDGPHRARRGRK